MKQQTYSSSSLDNNDEKNSTQNITVINYNNPTFNMNYSENIDMINNKSSTRSGVIIKSERSEKK